MANQLWCRDVFEGCTYVEQGESIREVLAQFMAHVHEVHKVTNPTPALRIQAMVAVRELPARAAGARRPLQ
jgi:predicted small metal-binding protein